MPTQSIPARILVSLALVLGVAAGCNTSRSSPDGGGTLPDGGGGGGGDGAVAVAAHLTGTVFAPNGMTPVAGALVYLTDTQPAPMPTQVYCDACVHLAASQPYVVTGADGSFTLPVSLAGPRLLVVQKGGFRRVRAYEVPPGTTPLDAALTTLPPKTDVGLGDEVPRMTVVQGHYDDIEDSLMKLGIDASAIEIVQSALIGQAAKTFLQDLTAVKARHIIFLPCGDFTQPPPNTDLSTDPTIKANLAAFVAAGGRLYATDWHYDFINRAFPGYITWDGAGADACSGCSNTPYDAPADVVDADLKAWLAAQQINTFSLVRNYTKISMVSAVTAMVGGMMKTVTPKVWMRAQPASGSATPATVSFEYGCGRVLFSTYHTEPSSLQLTPQERALLGILLDVSVCNDSDSGVIVQ